MRPSGKGGKGAERICDAEQPVLRIVHDHAVMAKAIAVRRLNSGSRVLVREQSELAGNPAGLRNDPAASVIGIGIESGSILRDCVRDGADAGRGHFRNVT